MLLSGEQIDADVGGGLPSPIGEEPAVAEEVSSLRAWMYSGGNPVRPAYGGLTRDPAGFRIRPESSCVGMRDSLDAYEAVVGLNVGRCWLGFLGCAGDRRG